MTSFLGSLLRRGRWTLWIGGAVGVLGLAWLLRGLDFGRFVEAANHLTVAVVGGICFAVEGISPSDVRRLRGRLANQGDRKDECR